MTPKLTIAGLSATAIIMGGIDVSALVETPLDRTEVVAEEIVQAKQIGNIVETTLPWKGEAGIKVKYDLKEPTLSEKFKDKRNQEVITETINFGDGGFKVDILLNEKPDTNCFFYQIEGWENYDFFYQPPLTSIEIEQSTERPEEIIGSYAVYSKAHRDNEYKTGKVLHIPYPYIWELDNATATKQRAESFDISNGIMSICASQAFLDNATYPVRIDPTFGYTSVGASSAAFQKDNVFGYATTSPVTGAIDSISMYLKEQVDGQNTYVKSALTVLSSGAIVTNGVGPAVQVMTTTPAWYTSTYSTKPSVTSGTEYILGFVGTTTSAGFQIAVYFDTSGASASYYDTSNSYDSPITWSPINGDSRYYSNYATYSIATPRSCSGGICGGINLSGGMNIK